MYPSVRSVSVVPVGLTRYSRVKNIRRPTPAEARTGVEQVEQRQVRLRRELGVGFVYPSDELYILAGREDVPTAADYDGYPALANGVGLLRSMLDEWQALTARSEMIREARRRDMWWLTGRLAAPALQRMAEEWHTHAGWRPTVLAVENAFFGNEISVSGLLSGSDLIRALREMPREAEDVVIPRGAFGFDGRHTLDGVSAEEVGDAHPGRVHLAASPRELLDILLGET
jgi:NifB/MoaA-like Fe-S oxidoreductase